MLTYSFKNLKSKSIENTLQLDETDNYWLYGIYSNGNCRYDKLQAEKIKQNWAKPTPFLWSGLQPANRRMRALSLWPFWAARCSAENPAWTQAKICSMIHSEVYVNIPVCTKHEQQHVLTSFMTGNCRVINLWSTITPRIQLSTAIKCTRSPAVAKR